MSVASGVTFTAPRSGKVDIFATSHLHFGEQLLFSIYTLSDLGNLSNLIGSLSRTVQQYSPPGEWIMCELDFSPIFLAL